MENKNEPCKRVQEMMEKLSPVLNQTIKYYHNGRYVDRQEQLIAELIVQISEMWEELNKRK